MLTDGHSISVYELRNAIWRVGFDLLDNSPKITDKRYGQLLVDLGNLLAQVYDQNPADYADFTEKIRAAVDFAKTVKF